MAELDLVAFERVLAHTKRRMRGGRGTRGLSVGLALLATTWIALRETRSVPLGTAHWLALSCLALLPTLLATLWPLPDERVAMRLDRHDAQDANERARSGVEFLRLPKNQLTPFMQAHLRELNARARGWSAARAVPARVPRELCWLAVPALAWLCTQIPRGADPKGGSTPAPIVRAPALSHDDLAAFQRDLHKLEEKQNATREVRDVRALNELLEQLATFALTRDQGIQALLSMEKRLLEQARRPSDADKKQLVELAGDLAHASDSLAKALRALDAKTAAQELRALAQRVLEKNTAERQRLQEALAQERKRQKAEEQARARESELESLLRKPRDESAESPSERSLFERRRRELDKLRRENAERSSRSRELARLSRDLGQAGDAMERQEESAARRALEEAARDLERFAERQRASEGARELSRTASQLRELLQRKAQATSQSEDHRGSGPSRHQEREEQFVMRARGQQGEQHALSLRPGESGEKQGGPPSTQNHSQTGQGSPSPGPGAGSSPEGQGQNSQHESGSDSSARTIHVLEEGTQGTEQLEVLIPRAQGTTAPSGSSPGHQRGDPNATPGEKLANASHTDSVLRGEHGRGPTRSQVILDAADRGFRSAPYQKVYSDYRSHAESVIEHDQVPAGHRFYVRRYFQLIRPRDE